MQKAVKNDFSQGKMWQNILTQAIPLTIAQTVQVLYNVVDRIYLGHLPGASSLALTGVGLIFPIVTLVTAFAICLDRAVRRCVPSRAGLEITTVPSGLWEPRSRCCLHPVRF